ncbi:head completion/stabilization protein [Luteibacter sp. NPDC031894]|uniref:head completion/stabilization protein n=1 Tax=Luteibacter sp. NPDC031894 TaxID=3390572 RepID=UPI003D0294BF
MSSSLLANGGAAAPNEPATPITISNDGFWPDIALGDLRDASRLTGNITDARLRACTVEAMIWANEQLASFKARQVAAGWDNASDIGDSIDGATILVQRYRRAVYCTVQADMAENYRQWDSTRAGDFRADFEDSAALTFRKDATLAISDILRRGRTVVELI